MVSTSFEITKNVIFCWEIILNMSYSRWPLILCSWFLHTQVEISKVSFTGAVNIEGHTNWHEICSKEKNQSKKLSQDFEAVHSNSITLADVDILCALLSSLQNKDHSAIQSDNHHQWLVWIKMAKPDSVIIPGLPGKIMEYCGGLTCWQPCIHQATFSLPSLSGTGEEK